MDGKQKKRRVSLGLRAMKTLIATAAIAILYSFFGRNPCFACIGAVFGMGNVFHTGLKNGGNRFVGTLLGGVVAIPFYSLYHDAPFGIPSWAYLTAGLAALLIIGQILGADGGIQPGAVVFYVVLLTVSENSHILYIVNRVIDTGIGVGVSLLINRIFPSPQEASPLPKFLPFNRPKAS